MDFLSGFSGHDTALLAPSLSSFLCEIVSERETCLHVFSKQKALIHLLPYQSWQRLQLSGALTAAVDVDGLQQHICRGPAGYCWAGCCLSASADTCRCPLGVPAQAAGQAGGKDGAGGEKRLHGKRGSALVSPGWAAERFIHLLPVLQLHLHRAKPFNSHSGCLRLCKG